MKKIIAAVLVSGMALGGYGVVNASPGEFSKHGHKGKGCQHGKKGRRLARMTAVLGLSKKQVAQIQAVKAKYGPRKMALRSEMRSEVNKILTPEQQAKKKAFRQSRHMGRHHGRHHH